MSAEFDEFSLLAALYPLQHTATKLAGATTAASAGSGLPKPENSLQWLKAMRAFLAVMGYNLCIQQLGLCCLVCPNVSAAIAEMFAVLVRSV